MPTRIIAANATMAIEVFDMYLPFIVELLSRNFTARRERASVRPHPSARCCYWLCGAGCDSRPAISRLSGGPDHVVALPWAHVDGARACGPRLSVSVQSVTDACGVVAATSNCPLAATPGPAAATSAATRIMMPRINVTAA